MKHIFWKIYAVIIGVMLAYGFIGMPLNSVFRWVDFAMFIIALTGLIMFAFLKKFLIKPFWAFYGIAFVGWMVYSYGFSPDAVKADEIIYAVMDIAIFAPMVVSLFLYGFGAKYIWQAPEKNEDGKKDDNNNISGE
ncbi:MAG: hypothetical protein Q8O09_04835 [Bacillota bacterium]|nr:hypothetical protein [Bacillota bacterium]